MLNRFLIVLFIFISCHLSAQEENVWVVKPHETLWQIANNYKQNSNIKVSQIMTAIFKKNPDAFNNHNLHQLKPYSILTIPTLKQTENTPNTPSIKELATTQNTTENQDSIAKTDSETTPNSSSEQTTISENTTTSTENTTTSTENTTTSTENTTTSTENTENDEQLTTAHSYDYADSLLNQHAKYDYSNWSLKANISDADNLPQTANKTVTVDADSLKNTANQINRLNQTIKHASNFFANFFASMPKPTTSYESQFNLPLPVGYHAPIKPWENNTTDAETTNNISYWLIALCVLISGCILTKLTSQYIQKRRIKPLASNEDDNGDYDLMSSKEGLPAKLHLARAYCDMQDYASAKKALYDVIHYGKKSPKLVSEAKILLKKIKHNK